MAEPEASMVFHIGGYRNKLDGCGLFGSIRRCFDGSIFQGDWIG